MINEEAVDDHNAKTEQDQLQETQPSIAPDVEMKVPDEVNQPTTQKPNYKLQYSLSGHTMSVSSLKFSPDGTMLVSAGGSHLRISLNSLTEAMHEAKPPTSS